MLLLAVKPSPHCQGKSKISEILVHTRAWEIETQPSHSFIQHKKNWVLGEAKQLRRPGIKPGSTAWKAAMLTIIPPTLRYGVRYVVILNENLMIGIGK